MEFQERIVKAMYVAASTLFVLLIVGVIGSAVMAVWTGDSRWWGTGLIGVVSVVVVGLFAASLEE
jgi:hypothetical protein